MLPDEKKTTAEEILLGIRFDLYIANHALLHEEEMPENERGSVYYSIQRIIERLDVFREKVEPDLMKIMVA